MALPELAGVEKEVSGGVAVMAHVGGFVAGLLLVKFFEDKRLGGSRTRMPRWRVS
jgi:membrane associated rhomboid family serine protease